MSVTLKDLIGIAKEISEECIEEAYEKLKEIKEKAERDQGTKAVECMHCGSDKVVRNGKRNNRQAYLCRGCGKSFVETSTSAIAHSHSSKTVWKQVIQDTIDGISIDKTAEALDLAHSTVFHMRHKILSCVERAISDASGTLDGVCEADETYVLESVKGRKIPEGYHRKPRKHGAKASKRGLSEEYICVCTSVDGDNHCMTAAVNRAAPGNADIERVFADKVTEDTVILCDGSKRYDVLEDRCTVAHTKRVNKANGFHSFIKQRLDGARGVATIYLNRYNALFSMVFGKQDTAADKIYALMTSRNGMFLDIASVKNHRLLNL